MLDCDALHISSGISFAFIGWIVSTNSKCLAVNGDVGNASATTNAGIEISDPDS